MRHAAQAAKWGEADRRGSVKNRRSLVFFVTRTIGSERPSERRDAHANQERGPPHRGEANALTAPSEPQPLTTEMTAVQEIIRGISETTGLEAQPAEPGWIAVTCNSRKMAAWLCATIIIENVEARCEGDRLLLPASPDFTLEKQSKSVIVVLAKTNHYWQAHVNGAYSPQLDTIQWPQP